MANTSSGNDLTYELDPSSALAALKRLQKEFATTSAVGTESGKKIGDGLSILINQIDKSVKAQNRLADSVTRTNAAWGKSGIERAIMDRDRVIKQLGTNEAAVKKVTASYDELIRKMKEVEKNSSGHGLGSGGAVLALRSARDAFEGRTAYAEVMGARALSTLSGGAFAGGVTAVAMAAIMTASFGAAKAVAEYGQRIHDLQIITGMSAREVQQFSFAAKLSGENADVGARLIRGLTQAVEDTSAHGETARKTLTAMGVDLLSLRTGVTAPLDLLRQLSTALEDQPNFWLRNQQAIELFKRAGIQSLPMIIELNRNLRESESIQFMSQDQINRADTMRHSIAKISEEWDQLILTIKGAVAQPFVIMLKFASSATDAGGLEFGPDGRPLASYKAGNYAYTSFEDTLRANLAARTGTVGAVRPQMSYGDVDSLLSRMKRTDPEAAQRNASGLKTAYDNLLSGGMVIRDGTQVPATVADIRAAADAYHSADAAAKALVRTEQERKSVLEAIRKLQIDAEDRVAHPYGRLKADEMLEQIQRLPGATSSQVSSARATLGPLRREEVLDIIARASGQVKLVGPHNEFASIDSASSIFGMGVNTIRRPGWQKYDDQQLREQSQLLSSSLGTDLRIRSGAAESDIRLHSLTGPQTPATRLATEREIANLRASVADEELASARSRISALYSDQTTREFALGEARLKYEEEIGKTRSDYQREGAQELRRQLDEIKGVADSLLHTLFTSPGKFGRQLGTTLLGAASRPFTNSISNSLSSWLQPMIYGTGAQAAMAGVGFGGASASTNSGPWGFGPQGMGGMPSIFGGGMGGLWGDNAPGGTPGFISGSLGLGGGGSASGGGGGGLLGGLRGITNLANLKSLFWNENINLARGVTQAASSMGFGGKLAGVLTSKGAAGLETSLGSMLAIAGMTGRNRGTGKGTFMSMLGGGLTGAGIGSMILPGIGTAIGAGIGALAGFGIGVGEQLAGVESQENQAMRMVNAIYHVGIGGSMAKQVVAIANQSYGGMVSIAVRSPEVRQLLSLYSAGTGQAFPQSANTPHGASFANMGGGLSQLATYQYGNPYSYTSQFPLSGGGFGNGGTFAAPGGGATYLSLSIGDRAAGAFMDGQYVTPARIASNYASALKSNNGRVQNALDLFDPGSVAV